MTHQEHLEAYRTQNEEMKAIAKELNLHLDLPGSPSAAQAFCEGLILCPTQHAAIEHVRQDRAGARAFLLLTERVLIALRSVDISNTGKAFQGGTPFFVLASAVQEYMRVLHQYNEDSWT